MGQPGRSIQARKARKAQRVLMVQQAPKALLVQIQQCLAPKALLELTPQCPARKAPSA
jgi:hypothetical protein